MTYTDDFGFEHHSHHCGCPRCDVPCGKEFLAHAERVEGAKYHVCKLSTDHGAMHVCECGEKTRVRVERKEAECWWDPKVMKRKQKQKEDA